VTLTILLVDYQPGGPELAITSWRWRSPLFPELGVAYIEAARPAG